MKIRSYLLLLAFFTFMLSTSFAGEGMWLPLLLQQLNEEEMQAMGMKMSAEDIYSVNEGSLKDAIVHFGGFCTGEVISKDGLVLTNHHCGYGQIQQHSSLDNNYLEEGFWAMDRSEELTNPGLFVTFIVRIEDVSEKVLLGVEEKMPEKARQSLIDKNLTVLREKYQKEDYQDLVIRPFYHGNQYFLFVTETYRDVRLVGAPPSSIGKFGADTDNWVWPRHTGDFSLFRIYASPDGKPAEYSEDNVPFQPRHHLPVSLDGVEEEDFTLVFGFPGRTDEYLPSVAMEQRVNVLNPIRIGIRDRSLEVLDRAMRDNPEARIQYASKQARIANGWKKWIGESEGIKATQGIEKRQAMEQKFQETVTTDEALRGKYSSLLPQFKVLYKKLEPFAASRDYVNEITSRNVELFRLVNILHRFKKSYDSEGLKGVMDRIPRLQSYLTNFYKDFSPEIDQAIATKLLDVYYEKVTPKHVAPYAKDQLEFAGGAVGDLAGAIYQRSFLTKPELVLQTLEQNPEGFFAQISGDIAYQYIRGILDFSEQEVFSNYDSINKSLQALQRKYMKALMEVFPDRRFYPDANSTMRVTYGQVDGYAVGDSLNFHFATYLKGVVDKYEPGDYEFDVPSRLLELYEEKEYGPYADQEGRMPVCFIGSNHTTGGNSGSPAIDAYGNLVGLNFDRSWHGTMSDINYDGSICRNIMVDARYILFIIDKFAGAGHLVEEMTLVHPKG